MFVRLVSFKVLPEKLDEFKTIYKKEIVPTLKKQKGNLDIRLLEPVDQADDFISISEWRTQADAETYASSGVDEQLVQKVEGLFTKGPVLKTYRVERVIEPAL